MIAEHIDPCHEYAGHVALNLRGINADDSSNAAHTVYLEPALARRLAAEILKTADALDPPKVDHTSTIGRTVCRANGYAHALAGDVVGPSGYVWQHLASMLAADLHEVAEWFQKASGGKCDHPADPTDIAGALVGEPDDWTT